MTYQWTGTQLTIFQWTLVAISFIVVVNRLYIDIKGIRTVAWYRDLMLVVSWLSFLIVAVCWSVMNDWDYNSYDWDIFLNQPEWQQIGAMKLQYISNYFYLACIYLVKADLLLMYHELAPRAHHPRIFWFIMFAWFWTIAGVFLQLGWFLFGCPQISDQWSLTPVQACQDMALAQMTSIWGLNIGSDLVIYVIPVFIIYRTQMLSIYEKLCAAAMFFVGFVNIMGAVFCLIGLLVNDWFGQEWDNTWEWIGVGVFMYLAQGATAIWIVCMPQIRSSYRTLRGKAEKETSEVLRERDVERDGYGWGGGIGMVEASPPMSSAGNSEVAREKWKVFKSLQVIARSNRREGYMI